MGILKGGTTIGGYEAVHKGNFVRLFGEAGIGTGMTAAEKAKLAGIADSANNYIHPVNHPASIITQDASNRFFTDTERAKLAGIADSANNYVHPTNHPPSIIAQDASNRFFTDTERTKLAGIADGATNYIHPATHPVSILTGVLPLANGGTGTTSKQGIVQLLYSDGDKTPMSNDLLYTVAFESSGALCGYIPLTSLKTKLQWSTAELQAALNALPNI